MRKFIDIVSESFGQVIDFNPQNNRHLFDLVLKANSGDITEKDIKEFSRYLRDNKMNFVRMYHGTAGGHDVMDKGLLPTSRTRAKSLQSASGYVYLAYDPQAALSFARMAYSGQNTDLVVYAVDVTVGRLLPDRDQMANKRSVGFDVGEGLAHSLIYGHAARVKGKIDPMQIHVYGRYDKNGNPIDA